MAAPRRRRPDRRLQLRLRVCETGEPWVKEVTYDTPFGDEPRNYADVVAHDLNQPVTGIQMLVGLLERRADQPPPAGVLEQLRDSTQRARDLIDGATVDVGELPEVDGDPRQLRRVLQNLLGNAVKFRGDAPLRVACRAGRTARSGC